MNFPQQDVTEESVISTILNMSQFSFTDDFTQPVMISEETCKDGLEVIQTFNTNDFPQQFGECSNRVDCRKSDNACRYSLDRPRDGEGCCRNGNIFDFIDSPDVTALQYSRESKAKRKDVKSSEVQGELSSKKTGRKRHSFTEEQTCELEKLFQKVKYPSRDVMEDFSSKHDLTYERIKNWFQNKRARLRKQIKFERKPSFNRMTPLPPVLTPIKCPVIKPCQRSIPCAEPSISSLAPPAITSKISALHLLAATCTSWTRMEPITTSCEVKNSVYPTCYRQPSAQWNNCSYVPSNNAHNNYPDQGNIFCNGQEQFNPYNRYLNNLQERYWWYCQQASMSGLVPQVLRNVNSSNLTGYGQVKHSASNTLRPGFVTTMPVHDSHPSGCVIDSGRSDINYHPPCGSSPSKKVVDLSKSSEDAEKPFRNNKENLPCTNKPIYNNLAVSKYDDIDAGFTQTLKRP